MTVRDEGAGTMEPTHRETLLAEALGGVLVKAGVLGSEHPGFTGPELLLAAEMFLAAPVSAPGMDREAVARIIRGWDLPPENARIGPGTRRAIDEANAKADQIIALQRGSEPADGSQVEPSTTGAGRPNPLEPPPFIQWNGGENPAPGKWVEVRSRLGAVRKRRADGLRWSNEKRLDDIIAYRIIPTDDQGGEGT